MLKKIRKYLKKSCYHCIECTVAAFLAAFMWRRPLNSIALAITTHRKPKGVSDGTDTQVRAQMINKCRIKMVQRDLYNVRDPPWKGERKLIKEHCSNQNYICNWFVRQNTSLDSEFIQLYSPCSWSLLNPYESLSNSLGSSSSTHSLQIYCTRLTGSRSHTS